MKSTSEQVYGVMRQMLVRGELRPGQRISQLRIARQIGCSAIPVVEAMRRLESEGVLRKEARKIARVRELRDHELRDLYVVREGLEAIAARLCAQRITDKGIGELRDLNEQFEATVVRQDVSAANDLDASIHHAIARFACCSLLEEELNRLLLIELTAARCPKPSFDYDRYRVSHRAIIEAIGNRDDNSAEYLMKRHIQDGSSESSE